MRLPLFRMTKEAASLQALNRGKHGRVGDLAIFGEFLMDLRDRRVIARPDHFHDRELQVTEQWDAPFSRLRGSILYGIDSTWVIVLAPQ